eukprot:Skav219567  [mRNA]  locus=scaffold886:113683:117079:- [translate_table: standard]
MQEEVLGRAEYLCKLADELGTYSNKSGEEAALRALLQGRTEYDVPALPVTLARFDLERISIPETLKGLPDLAELLPEEALRFLNSQEQMLKQVPLEDEVVVPYYDPALKIDKNYRSIIQKLHDIGYLRYTRSPKAHAGMFFVHKSDGKKIRLIVDARPANQMFRSPPGVELCTAEGFSRIEVEVPEELQPGTAEFAEHLQSKGLYFGLADVKDCFHRMRQPEWLSKYFCWRPIPVKWIHGLIGSELEGQKVSPEEKVYPMPASLCMGFSWSLYFAQKANETLMGSMANLKQSCLISDRGQPVVFPASQEKTVRHYVYVDNLGVVSPDKALVQSTLEELAPGFEKRGLVLHPGEVQHEEIKALGVYMRGDLMASRVSPQRHAKLKQAIGGVLRRKKVSGRILEIVLGHITFCCLCNRQLLSIFSAIYKYIQREYFKPAILWDSVVTELRVFRGLMIYLHSDWWRGWNNLVSASDASLEGFGVSTSYWNRKEVAEAGRTVERARFKKAASTAARDHALSSAGFVQDNITQKWRLKEISDDELLQLSGWEVASDFKEIPSHLLAKDLWEPKQWGRWDFEGKILELEGRALVKSLKRIALSIFGSSVRQLLLVDNMAVALAFDRFRSRNFKLLKQIRKFSSHLLARNIAVTVRREKVLKPPPKPPLPRKRTAQCKSAVLKVEHGEAPKKKRRALDPPQPFQDLLTPQEDYVPGLAKQPFNLRDVELPSLSQVTRTKRGRSPSSTSSTTVEQPHKQPKREQTRALVDGVMNRVNLSLLEHNAIGNHTRKLYTKEMEEFVAFGRPRGLNFQNPELVDKLVVDHLNQLYSKGYRAYRGDRLTASILHFHPQYGKLGDKSLPRTWRALRGFRKLTPGRSRLAYPLPIWAAMAAELRRMNRLRMAVFMLVAVSTYARPSELLRLRLFSLVRPQAGITDSWSLLMSPEERPERSKTGEYDVSILLDSPWLLPWLPTLLKYLKQGYCEDPLWDFNYGEYSKAFMEAAKTLKLEVTPYQTRHSGPSIDRARKYRSLAEVQKRGHWKSTSSVDRYEKSARLAATFDSLPEDLKLHSRRCEHDLSAIMLGTMHPPSFNGSSSSRAAM